MAGSNTIAECEISLPAAVDLSAAGKIAISINASAQVAICGVGLRPDGLLKNFPTAGQEARFNWGPGVHKVQLGGTVAAGDQSTVGANGLFIKAVAAGGIVVGRFLDAGVAGNIVRMLVPVFNNGSI